MSKYELLANIELLNKYEAMMEEIRTEADRVRNTIKAEMEAREVQPSNTSIPAAAVEVVPSVSSALGNLIEVMSEQPLNARSPIVATFSGITNSPVSLQVSNAAAPIATKRLGRTIFESCLQ